MERIFVDLDTASGKKILVDALSITAYEGVNVKVDMPQPDGDPVEVVKEYTQLFFVGGSTLLPYPLKEFQATYKKIMDNVANFASKQIIIPPSHSVSPHQ